MSLQTGNEAKRLEILLLVAWLVGLAGRAMQWHWQLQANTERKRDVLSTFFIGRQLLLRPDRDLPSSLITLALLTLRNHISHALPA